MLRHRLTWLAPALLLLCAAPVLAQSETVVVGRAGRGPAGAILQHALSVPHRAIRGGQAPVSLPRDSTYATTILVIGGDATVGSTVQGDVIVVGGDLFLHPGASISGRAIAIGGGVYNSSLARVVGGTLEFRDLTFDAVDSPGRVTLEYRALDVAAVERVSFPIIRGFRLPEYTRVDGAVLPWGPRLTLAEGRLEIDPTVTYRTDLGKLDPAIGARMQLTERTLLDGRIERATLSNDRWIQSDIANTLSTLVRGRDYRNYYRADRAELRLRRLLPGAASDASVWIGMRGEKAWSVREGGPWSLTERTDTLDGILRPNPMILPGTIGSALLGGSLEWASVGVKMTSDAELELPFASPGSRHFTQATVNATLGFPTFGTQTFSLLSHVVYAVGDSAPPQRYAYLGNTGTLPTFRLLELGGDRLLSVMSIYEIPLERFRLPIVGAPSIGLIHMLGAAGVHRLPPLEQNLGFRLTLTPLRVEFDLDPASKRTAFGVGLTLVR
ncbi:MAG: hypothetical protein M3068_11895 [Gemmatimonadota bacterium]|nr:hypothetical protein [Gemmatimonadota bacterium]